MPETGLIIMNELPKDAIEADRKLSKLQNFVLDVAGKVDKDPLYACTKFKGLPHGRKVSLLKEHGFCMNSLRPGHFVRKCQSQHKCRKCQRPHHAKLHVDTSDKHTSPSETQQPRNASILSHTSTNLFSSSLLMTCQFTVNTPDGSARVLLDSASSAYFISEHLAQSIALHRSPLSARILGVTSLMQKSHTQSTATFTVSTTKYQSQAFTVTAVIVPHITCDLPQSSLSHNPSWQHLHGLQMADQHFAKPGRINILLGVDV